jgi:AcrR family transcriptional regulator
MLERDISLYYKIYMPRPAKFHEAEILAVASDLVASAGPGGATVGAIASRLKAPSGSIYHRFATRDVLLGRLWLQKAAAFQGRVTAALSLPDARAAGLAAALTLPAAARADVPGARILLLHRREDFGSDRWPPELTADAARLEKHLDGALAGLTRRLFGGLSPRALRLATFAIHDLPFAAVRRHVAADETPPPFVDELIRAAYTALTPAPQS